MRSRDRIKPFCDRLALAWERCPDLRFGQLIVNAYSSSKRDPFFIEDDDSLKMIETFTRENSPYYPKE